MPVSFDLGVQVIATCFVSLELKLIGGERSRRDQFSRQLLFLPAKEGKSGLKPTQLLLLKLIHAKPTQRTKPYSPSLYFSSLKNFPFPLLTSHLAVQESEATERASMCPVTDWSTLRPGNQAAERL